MPGPTSTPAVESINVPNSLADSITTARIIQRALQSLDPDDASAIKTLLDSTLDKEQAQRLQLVTSTDAFKKATPETMAAILKVLAQESRNERGVGLHYILCQPNFAKLNTEQQVGLIELAAAHGTSGIGISEPLGLLLSQTSADGSLRLLGTDSAGRTLLENLRSLSASSFQQRLVAAKITPHSVIQDVAREVSSPSRFVDQGNRGACAAASIQDLLCRNQPAEYVRIITGLCRNGSVRTNGGTLSIVPESIVALKDGDQQQDFRSHAERLFQSALLNEVSSIGSYSYAGDSAKIDIPKQFISPSVRSLVPNSIELPVGGGMTDSELRSAMTIVFGKDKYGAASGDGTRILQKLRASTTPCVVTMQWDKGLHALVYCGSDRQYVYLKDPNGWTPPSDDERFKREPSVGNTHAANIRVSVADFERYVRAAHIPSDTLAALRGPTWSQTTPRNPVTPVLDRVLPTPTEVVEHVQDVERGIERNVSMATTTLKTLTMPAVPVAVGTANLLQSWLGRK